MKPMDINSTPFVSYHDIKFKDVNLIEDAWGLNYEFCDVIELFRQVKVEPGKMLTKRLIDKIRQQN